MTTLAVTGGTILTPWQRLDHGTVLIDGAHVESLTRSHPKAGFDSPVLDATGYTVVPGFVDLQVDGTAGIDCMRASTDELADLCRILPRYGCTSFLPTLVTASGDRLRSRLATIAELIGRRPDGASPLGAHLEGPYLTLAYKGAHDSKHVRPFDVAEWRSFVDVARGALRLTTVAPEAPGNANAVTVMRASGCVVSMGHSNATYDEACQAVLDGATMTTHTWNAMRPLHHREPGLPGAALDFDDVVAAVIPDGIHVAPSLVRLLVRSKGPQGVAAVTDAAWVAGLPAGDYEWEGRTLHHDGVAPRLTDGTLAGSGATADGLLRTLVSKCGLSLMQAVHMLATTPARVLGLSHQIGALRPGSFADFALLDPDLGVVGTVVRGRLVYRRTDGPVVRM